MSQCHDFEYLDHCPYLGPKEQQGKESPGSAASSSKLLTLASVFSEHQGAEAESHHFSNTLTPGAFTSFKTKELFGLKIFIFEKYL